MSEDELKIEIMCLTSELEIANEKSERYKKIVDNLLRLIDYRETAASDLFEFIAVHADKRFLAHATKLMELRKRLLDSREWNETPLPAPPRGAERGGAVK